MPVAQSQSKRTIGGKLNKLVLLSVGLALLVGGLLSAWGNAQSFVVAKREVLQATAQVFRRQFPMPLRVRMRQQ